MVVAPPASSRRKVQGSEIDLGQAGAEPHAGDCGSIGAKAKEGEGEGAALEGVSATTVVQSEIEGAMEHGVAYRVQDRFR